VDPKADLEIKKYIFIFFLSGIEPRFLARPTGSLVTKTDYDKISIMKAPVRSVLLFPEYRRTNPDPVIIINRINGIFYTTTLHT
jgi:hypothetical protein